MCLILQLLTLKAPITTAADNNLFFFFFSEKTSHDISSESSAWQTIHMKCQDLFSLKKKKPKNFECLLQILLGALRVNTYRDVGRVIVECLVQWSVVQSQRIKTMSKETVNIITALPLLIVYSRQIIT